MLFDSLSAAGEHWTAWSGEESKLATNLALNHTQDAKKALQMTAGYGFLASRRDSETMSATVSDKEAAKAIPRLNGKKGGAIAADTYRKGVKLDLKACGLVDFNTDPGERKPTRYTFPAIVERLKALGTCGGIICEDPAPCGEFVHEKPAPPSNQNPAPVRGNCEEKPRTMRANHSQGMPSFKDSCINYGKGAVCPICGGSLTERVKPIDSGWFRGQCSEGHPPIEFNSSTGEVRACTS